MLSGVQAADNPHKQKQPEPESEPVVVEPIPEEELTEEKIKIISFMEWLEEKKTVYKTVLEMEDAMV